MNLKKWVGPLLILVIILSVVGYFINKKPIKNEKEEIHYHAGFQVYIDDQLQDFSDINYMHIMPCGVEGHTEIEEDEQLEKAHLHDGFGDVVHVHRNGATWGDLFININFTLSSEVMAYVNNQSIENILSYPINPYDSVIIIQGELGDLDEKLKESVTREHIVEAEGLSETCGS